jgi:hypothetical protein
MDSPVDKKVLRACGLYGLRLKSAWALPGCPDVTDPNLPAVEFAEGPAALFAEAAGEGLADRGAYDWFHRVRLRDGWDYLRWSGLFEFLVSACGHRVIGRPLRGEPDEAFQTYLLGQVLSFALIKMRIEPLHATALVVDGKAVVLLGDCGYGKSTLGAAFLRAGARLLTDDLLVVRAEANGYVAFPGPPRIKLFPDVARTVLGDVSGTPMNPATSKLVIPLGPGQSSPTSRAVRAVYVLRPPASRSVSQSIRIRTLRPRQALLKLIGNTFNTVIRDRERLARQFFQATRLAAAVPVKSLSYPKQLSSLPLVVEAVCADL